MADKKAERLINLTLALLATKRYLKKSEIFKTVSGYTGNPESMDRMFERDKNELRNLGIDISVGDLDPLFDDEPGYRIFRDSYAFQLKDLEPADVAILSVAAKLWNDSVLGVEAQSGLLKLESANGAVEDIDSLTFGYRYEDPTANLAVIESAIFEEKSIEFNYRDGNSKRQLNAFRIFLWNGFWYVIGEDPEKNAIRSFKISRMVGDVKIGKTKYKVPDSFNISEFLPRKETFEVLVSIEEGKGFVLRNHGSQVDSKENVDVYRLIFSDLDTALRELLRHGNGVKVLQPTELASALKAKLELLANV